MNAKLLLLGLAVVLMTATESSNAHVERALRKRQEGASDEDLEELLDDLVALEDLAYQLEDAFGETSPVKRALRKRQVGDNFDITGEDLEALLDVLVQLEKLAMEFIAELGDMKRRRRR